MKRLFCIFSFLILSITINANVFKHNNILESYVRYNNSNYLKIYNYQQASYIPGYQFSLIAYGIYLDIMFNEYGDHSINKPLFINPAYETLDWYIGYCIPITDNIKIIPIIGQNIICEKYINTKTYYALDYGCIFQVNLNNIDFQIEIEPYNVEAGISIPIITY